jgi:ferredoxin
LCVSIASDMFKIEDDPKAGVIGEVTSSSESKSKDDEMLCSVAAIKVE